MNKETASKQNMSIKRFAITYVVLMSLFFLLIALKPIQNILDLNGLYTQAILFITAEVLKIMGLSSTIHGTVINVAGTGLDVKFGCNGLEAVMIYTVGIISFPATWRKRLLGIAWGFLVIQVVNILRIVALAYSYIYFKTLFDYIHVYVAQGIMIAIALGVYLLWINYAKKGP
jgi:exosortase H (IPTLxxWG-CTERM-specific)